MLLRHGAPSPVGDFAPIISRLASSRRVLAPDAARGRRAHDGQDIDTFSWQNLAMTSATKNFHVPLPEALYDELRTAAREADRPATKFAQDLMRAGLDEWRRTRRRQQVAAYAREVAGTEEDLDTELERAGVAALVDLDR